MPDSYPDRLLRLLELGELTDEERERARVRAQGAIRAAEWMNYTEDVGAVRTGPAGAGVRMRERRDARALAWERVQAALG